MLAQDAGLAAFTGPGVEYTVPTGPLEPIEPTEPVPSPPAPSAFAAPSTITEPSESTEHKKEEKSTFIPDIWLAAEFELLDLRERGVEGEVLTAATKRCAKLWKQVLKFWGIPRKRAVKSRGQSEAQHKAQPKVQPEAQTEAQPGAQLEAQAGAQAEARAEVPVEQSSEHDEMTWRSEDVSYRVILNEWLKAHRDDPYPSRKEKERLARETGRTLQQIDWWFMKARRKSKLTLNPNFSPDQIATLCASFEMSIYPSADENQRLASETGLSAKQVHIWFRDRRTKPGLRAQRELPADQKAPLLAWLHAHVQNPHPSTNEKKELAKETGLSLQQIRSWFSQSRKKIERNKGKEEFEGRCPCCGMELDLVVPAQRSHELEKLDEPGGNSSELHEPEDLEFEDESQWSDSQLLDLEDVNENVTLSELVGRDGSEVDVGELSEVYEQDESEDSSFDLDEPEAPEQPEELDEEPPRKRPRLQASQHEVRPSSADTKTKRVEFTIKQKDLVRAWLCANLGNRRLLVEEIEPVAKAAGLTVEQVRAWIHDFYYCNPDPTLEQATAWRSEDISYRDILKELLMAHRDDPNPSHEEKEQLARETGRTLQQINWWFQDARQIKGLNSNPYFSPDQIATLRASFEEHIYPSSDEKQRLVSETRLSAEQVGKWFSVRRRSKGLGAQKELPADQKAPLFAWLHANIQNPFPSADKKKELVKETGLTLAQVQDWFRRSRERTKRNQGKKDYEGRCPCCGEVLDQVVPVESSHEQEEVNEPDSKPGEPGEPQDVESEDESQWFDGQLLDLEEVDENVELGEPGGQDGFGELSEVYEQDESEDSDFELDEPEAPEQPEELDEEPPRKRSRLQASQHEARPSSSLTKEKFARFTGQQKDHMRALICKHLGTPSLPLEDIEPVAKTAGLTIKQVRGWIWQFYRYNPDPTREQVMAWKLSSHRDVLEKWLTAHRDDPYPSRKEKDRLARETGKTSEQVDSWFTQARRKNELISGPKCSPDQTATLCASFEENIYPSAGEMQRLANETGLSAKQVQMWFVDRRRKEGLAPQRKLPADQRAPLLAWLHANMEDPHPSANKKKELAKEAGLTLTQVQNWFGRSRERTKRNEGKKEYEGRCPCCGEALDLVVPAQRSHELYDLEAPEHPDELDEESPRKRSRLQASEHEARPSSPGPKTKSVPFTTQQKDHIRALLCKTLGVRRLPVEEIEPVAKAAGLTVYQVRVWMKQFYRYNLNPTLELAMAWRSERTSYRDILNDWLMAHLDDPYPSLEEKERLARETGKTSEQVDSWFKQARRKNELSSNRKFSPDQTATLRASFEEHIYPSSDEKQRLASETRLSAEQVSKWFADRRRSKGLGAQKELPADQKAPLFAWLHANMKSPCPSADKKKELAKESGLTLKQTQHWFFLSRRRIERNQGKKEFEGRCPCCGEANI